MYCTHKSSPSNSLVTTASNSVAELMGTINNMVIKTETSSDIDLYHLKDPIPKVVCYFC